jgi:flagellar biosynthesis/type III secretory pathway M-ring protein FliF/YscJ
MKNKIRWFIIAVVVLALVAGIWRALAAKRMQKEAAAAPAGRPSSSFPPSA